MTDPFAERDAMRARMGTPEGAVPDERALLRQSIEQRERAERQAAMDALAAREAAAPKNAIELAGQTAQQGRQDAIDQARLIDASKKRVEIDNKNYGPDKAYTDAAEGSWDVRPVFNQETGEVMTQPVFDEAGNVKRNADGSIQQEMVTEQVWNPGFIEEQQRTADEAGKANIDAERKMSAYMAQQSLRTDLEQEVQRDREIAYDNRLRAQEEAVAATDAGVANAKRALQEQPDVDPNRFWADKGAGFKVLAVLQGVLSGFVGQDATKILRDAIQTDIEAQRANIGKRESEVGAAVDAGNQAHQTYREIMAEVGDQRQADLMYETARLEAARDAFLQKQKEFGIQVLTADHQAFLARLEEEIAQKHNQAQRMAAANVETFTRTINTMGRAERQARQKLIDQDIKTAGDATAAGIGQAGAMEMEGAKRQTTIAAKQSEDLAKGRRELSDRVAPMKTAVSMIDRMLSDYEDTGSLSGRRLGDKLPWAGSNDQKRLVPLLHAALNEGAMQEHEETIIRDLIESGWGSDAGAENLRAAREILSMKIDASRRGFDESTVGAYTNSPMAPGAAPSVAGFGGARGSVVQED